LVEDVEERFAGVNGAVKASVLQSFSLLDDLLPFVETLLRGVSVGEEQLLASEERAYFLTISQRPGQKPAPFIPILDANFEVWFKKVNLISMFVLFLSLIKNCRTRSGLLKILRQFSTKTRSAFAFCKALSLSNTPLSRTSLSRTSSAISTLHW
jgi:hypothetical protein